MSERIRCNLSLNTEKEDQVKAFAAIQNFKNYGSFNSMGDFVSKAILYFIDSKDLEASKRKKEQAFVKLIADEVEIRIKPLIRKPVGK